MVTNRVWLQAVSRYNPCLVTSRVWSQRVSSYKSCLITTRLWLQAVFGDSSCLVTNRVWLQAVSVTHIHIYIYMYMFLDSNRIKRYAHATHKLSYIHIAQHDKKAVFRLSAFEQGVARWLELLS